MTRLQHYNKLNIANPFKGRDKDAERQLGVDLGVVA